MRKALLALIVAITVVSTPLAGTVAASPGLNFSSDDAPDPAIVEDELTIATHDRGDMSGPLQYYNDSGEVETLPATVNQSQDTPVSLRFDRVDSERYRLFPRVDGEVENSASWINSADWTTSSGASSSVSVSDADARGIQKVQVSSTVATGEQATATLADNVSITSDANKRVMFAVINVDSLASGSEVQLRATDSDGDYRYANISASEDANADWTIANSTGNGYVFQERLGELPLAGSGDGSMGEIQSVDIVTMENDATVTVSGLDLDKKSETDLATVERDTDGDGSLEETTVQDYYEGGYAATTSLSTLGSDYSDAQIKDLKVSDVRYQFSDLSDSSDYDVSLTDGDTPHSYPAELELYADLKAPSAIDLSHGTLNVELEQTQITERYATVEVASGASDETDFSNSTYSDVSSSLVGQDETATLASGVSSDSNERIHMVVKLKQDQFSDLQATGGAAGPTGTSGGFFSSLGGQITGLLAGIGGALGLRRIFGSG